MRKLICVTLLAFFFIGCNTADAKVVILEQTDLIIKMYIPNHNNGFDISANQYSAWFDITGIELMDMINKKSAEKGYPALVVLPRSTETHLMLSFDEKTWYILVNARTEKDGYLNVSEVELSLYINKEQNAEMNGDYLYLLMDIFSPDMKEDICELLDIFGESKSELPTGRQVYCGNTIYTFIKQDNVSDKFTIRAYAEPDESKNPPSAIKPS